LNKKVSTLLVAFAFFVLATILFLLPGSSFPKQNWLTPILNFIWFDKWVHVSIFIALVYLWCRAFFHRISLVARKKNFLFILTLFIAYGIFIEFVQQRFILNRSFEVFDIVADTSGAVIGFVLASKRFINKETPVETGVVNQN
jgi:hypothetical protein